MKEHDMWKDPIVEEVHAIRRQLLEAAGGDIHEVIRLAQLAQLPSRKIFRGTPRRPVGWTEVVYKVDTTK
jgi:hypothetical protein